MDKKMIGIFFCLMALFSLGIKYISMAIISNNYGTAGYNFFNENIYTAFPFLTFLFIFFLSIGFITFFRKK
ncbi:hypothetical protein GMB70_14910 [Turicibacter sanguinis]|uniref:hypothetical protein n=1 Tax=Turicibacter sanguinis TaxID=154288 RepID=UPI0012BCB7C7|nr:hypothetical protein [Turicibacter sanguinis]MCU7195532.1 hypothetical protein [Turicibacter sanguinis]MDB8553809.1 hypothetical protein [Turicibacter sanguinis]MTP79929.1 hypothetical protein [Turicibacter sanguinis]